MFVFVRASAAPSAVPAAPIPLRGHPPPIDPYIRVPRPIEAAARGPGRALALRHIHSTLLAAHLIDELTGEPVCDPSGHYPIEIKTPSDVVPKLLPVMQVGMRAMSLYNGVAGVARMVGYPVPKVPEGWCKGAQSSVEMLKLVRI